MYIVENYKVSETESIYTVCVADGYYADVKVCHDSGLVYIMENEDGSTIYGDNTDCTFPKYKYKKNKVLRLVKDELEED